VAFVRFGSHSGSPSPASRVKPAHRPSRRSSQVRQLEQEIRPVVVVPLPEINELLSDFGGFVLCHAIAI
jgi:hypothetical protein